MIKLNFPKPISVNAAFATDWKTKRRFRTKAYEHWVKEAEATLRLNRWQPIKGPVNVSLTIEDKGAVDLANHEKVMVDFLVKHQLIEDDTRKIVRSLHLQWGDVDGCVVEISPI